MLKNPSARLIIAALLSSLHWTSPRAQAVQGKSGRYEAGLQSMEHVETLPFLYENGTRTRQFDAYDPSGGNMDGSFTNSYTRYIDKNGEYVIFDASGPGCLYRQQFNIWCMGLFMGAEKAHIKFYFDQEEKPRIDLGVNDLFSGNVSPFLKPYTHFDSSAKDGRPLYANLYYPLSFKKGLKITTTDNFNKLLEGANLDVRTYNAAWYQYTYITFPTDSGVKSWNKDVPDDAYRSIAGKWANHGDPKPAENNIPVTSSMAIPAGSTRTIADLSGEGSISKIQLHLENYSRTLFFHTRIRIFWDGAITPAVDMPLANFFGGGGENYKDCQDIHMKSLHTLLFGFNGQTHDFYSYWPMPYWKSARIELRNESSENIDNVKVNVEWKPGKAYSYPAATSGYFYAKRTISRDPGHDLFANAFREKGHGHVAGISFYSDGYAMDGDEFTYIDGSHTPQIHGNGTEDDHNQGWGGVPYQAPLWGGLVNGYQGAYRLYLNDSYIFNKDININYEFSMEGGEDYGGEVDAVVFYYKSPSTENLTLSDVLDVGNAASEKAHKYVIEGKKWAHTSTSGYDAYERDYEYDVVRDNGYAYDKYAGFTASIDPANEGIRLRRRIYRSGNGIQHANVYVDGVLIKERTWDICTLSSAPFYQAWFDDDFEIPSSYTKGRSSIRIKVEFRKDDGSRKEINEFYYWVYSYGKAGSARRQNRQDNISGYDRPDKHYIPATPERIKDTRCTFLRTDTSTLGDWTEVYGHEGFILPQYFYGRNLQVMPGYLSHLTYGNMKGHQFSTFNTSTPSSLHPNPLNYDKRYLGGVESSSVDSIGLYVNDTRLHQLAMYFCDFDKKGRKQDIEILDFKGDVIVAKQEVSHFEKGKWLLYSFSGSIRVRISNRNEQTTAVLSALMFD
jgi:hypothetical protein